MSRDIAESDGVKVTEFCGPVRDDGGDRLMYQISQDINYVWLTAEQVAWAASIVAASAAPRAKP